MSSDPVSAKSYRAQRTGSRIAPAARWRGRPAFRRHASARILRWCDICIALVLLAVLAIPMLLIALLVRLSGRGPIIYAQQRVGLGGRPFVMYKFRTMRVDAEATSGPVWATRDDPRRTAAGVLLSRLSLDELPQLVNVLRGEMSLVGPRPERACFVERFAKSIPAYRQRHQVLPGITGWAQINGWRGDTPIEKRVECDLYYVNNRSLALYLRILLLTPLRLFVERKTC
jgi:putative colanic acid biosynthesis UDP-glucose lipid carrier transferase